MSRTIIATAIILSSFFTLGTFKENSQSVAQTVNTPPQKIMAKSVTSDPHVIISGFQRYLEPAGLSLTDKQQKKITEKFNPSSPTDMRPVIGVLTKDQKKVFVKRYHDILDKSEYPLTKKQESRIMAVKPGSRDEGWHEILTQEQNDIMLQAEGWTR